MNQDDTDLLICRCEEVTKGEILDAIQNGAHSLWQIRRMTRCGLGLCQGRTCEQLVGRILAEALHVPIESVLLPSRRPPVRPLAIDVLASGERIDLE